MALPNFVNRFSLQSNYVQLIRLVVGQRSYEFPAEFDRGEREEATATDRSGQGDGRPDGQRVQIQLH